MTKTTRPIYDIVNELEFKRDKLINIIRSLLPDEDREMVNQLANTSWSIGALRVVAKSADQAQAIIEVVTKR